MSARYLWAEEWLCAPLGFIQLTLIALVPQVPVGIGGALLIAVFGFFFAIVSVRMVGLVGCSNTFCGCTLTVLVHFGKINEIFFPHME